MASTFLEQKPCGHFVPLPVFFFHSRLSCPQQKGTGRTVCFPNGRQEHCDPCVVEATKLLSLLVLYKRALILPVDSRARQRYMFFSPLPAALLQVIHRLILIDSAASYRLLSFRCAFQSLHRCIAKPLTF